MAENTLQKQKAIVIGASSGIGRALAKVFGEHGYAVGLAARRLELLHQLQKEIPAQTFIKRIDISKPEEAMPALRELIEEMRGADVIVINSGINAHNVSLEWPGENDTIKVNVAGFCAMANIALKYFEGKGAGQLVGISSIAGLRGSATSPAYSASKAFVSNYLEGLRHRVSAKNIYISDIRPGLVDTEMIKGFSRLFWVASADQAARQILRAIQQKKSIAYITRRWLLIAWLLKIMPDWVYRLRYKNEF
ncbi:MAG: SDR family NAD(P)-dependent oxidoreductase [Candidatus Omnitrophota bacterium]